MKYARRVGRSTRRWSVVALVLLSFCMGHAFPAESQVEVTPADSPRVSGVVSQERIDVGIETDNLVELPFDRPFTLTLSFSNVDLRGAAPVLTYKDFPKRLDVLPTCSTGEPEVKSATLAGITHEVENGKPVSKARFFITGVPPNRYWLFCYESTAAISVDLGAQTKERLLNEIKTALWTYESEILPENRERLSGSIRAMLSSALRQFARAEGLSGTVELNEDLTTGDLVTAFLDVRQSVVQCDSDTLQRTLAAAEASGLSEIARRRSEATAAGRASFVDCLHLLRFAGDRVAAAGMSPAERNTMEARIQRSLSILENSQSAFVAQSIQALQRSSALIMASSIGGDSVAMRYVSADTGLAYVPELDRSVPYAGINLYLRPVNPPSITPLGSGQQGNLAQRFSFTLAFTAGDDLKQEQEFAGGDIIQIVDDWTDAGSLLVGAGFRVNPALRLGGGAVAYRQLDSLVDAEMSTEVSYYFSISLDVNVMRLFRADAGGLFSGGTPTGEDD